MMKKLSGINSDQILDIALNEAKEICDEDEKFCENIGCGGQGLNLRPSDYAPVQTSGFACHLFKSHR